MHENYKSSKEAFVSNMTGSSVGHINLLSLAAVLSVSLYGAVKTRLHPRRRVGFLISWTILVLPLLLSMTVFATLPLHLNGVLLLANLLIYQLPSKAGGIPLPSNASTPPSTTSPSTPRKLPPLPALTTYRAHMMLMTVLAILAVDFPVFPRSLVKCETFGASLMDLGVGSFVFSQGVVSAIPLLKNPYYLKAPFLPKIISVTSKSLPIIALGLIRVVLVKGTDYPEHVTEYGVHWNFFITLALLPVLQAFLHPILQHVTVSAVGVVLAISQEILLSRFSLKEYVLEAPRTSFVGANKEGIASLLGYLAIHVLGLSVGTIILAPTPSFFSRCRKALFDKDKRRSNALPDLNAPRQIDKMAVEICAYAAIWWFLLGVTKVQRIGGDWGALGGISRRMVNLPYIFWTTAYNTSFLLLYLLLDMWIFADKSSESTNTKRYAGGVPKDISDRHMNTGNKPRLISDAWIIDNPPKLFDEINKHGLAIFLIANLFTGLINLSIPTMYMGNLTAMCILSVYSVMICAIGWYWPS